MSLVRVLPVLTTGAVLVALLLCVAELARWAGHLPPLRRLERRWHVIPQQRWLSTAAIPLATVFASVPVSYGVNLVSDADGGRGLPGHLAILLGLAVAGWYYVRHAAGSYDRIGPKVRQRRVLADAREALAHRGAPDLRTREATRVALRRVARLGRRLATYDDGGWRQALRREHRWLLVLTALTVAPPLLLLVLVVRHVLAGTANGRPLLVVLLALGGVALPLLALASRRYRIRTERHLLGRELQEASDDLLRRLFDPDTMVPVPASVLDEIARTLRRAYGWPLRSDRPDRRVRAGRSVRPVR